MLGCESEGLLFLHFTSLHFIKAPQTGQRSCSSATSSRSSRSSGTNSGIAVLAPVWRHSCLSMRPPSCCCAMRRLSRHHCTNIHVINRQPPASAMTWTSRRCHSCCKPHLLPSASEPACPCSAPYICRFLPSVAQPKRAQQLYFFSPPCSLQLATRCLRCHHLHLHWRQRLPTWALRA